MVGGCFGEMGRVESRATQTCKRAASLQLGAQNLNFRSPENAYMDYGLGPRLAHNVTGVLRARGAVKGRAYSWRGELIVEPALYTTASCEMRIAAQRPNP
jgi:hypothetical protein